MTALLPPNLLKLFAPRPQPQFLKPLTKDERNRGPDKLTGVAALLAQLKEDAEEAELKQGLEDKQTAPESSAKKDKEVVEAVKVENGTVDGEDGEMTEKENGKEKEKEKEKPKKKKSMIEELGLVGQAAIDLRRELRKKRRVEYKANLEKSYRPQDDASALGDPYKTLFISRLSKKTTEADLRREFEMYGNIERVRIVRNRKGKSNSYAFIVYERERDMKAAYKDAEGIPIHHKKILVDVERGRTVKGWKPRKLGGGLGGRPKPIPKEEAVVAPFAGGGFRGGFGGRGGFRGGPPGGGFGGRGGGGGFRGGGFRGGFGGSDRGGFGGGDRGGFSGGGDRGGFQSGGGFRGGFGGPRGGGADRGGFTPGGGRGGYGGSDRGGYQGGGGFGGPPGGGFQQQSNGSTPGGGGGYKRDFEAPVGGGGGGYGPPGGGYEDRDPKRPRY